MTINSSSFLALGTCSRIILRHTRVTKRFRIMSVLTCVNALPVFCLAFRNKFYRYLRFNNKIKSFQLTGHSTFSVCLFFSLLVVTNNSFAIELL